MSPRTTLKNKPKLPTVVITRQTHKPAKGVTKIPYVSIKARKCPPPLGQVLQIPTVKSVKKTRSAQKVNASKRPNNLPRRVRSVTSSTKSHPVKVVPIKRRTPRLPSTPLLPSGTSTTRNQETAPDSIPPSTTTASVEQPPPPSPTIQQVSFTRAFLFFRGLGRRQVWQVRCLLTSLGIVPKAVQHISFIGVNVLVLIILDSFKEEVIGCLARINLKHDPSFDPLTPRCFTNAATIERLGLVDMSEEEKASVARQAFASHIDSMLCVIGKNRYGLRSYLVSLQKAVRKGDSITRFLDPSPPPPPLPSSSNQRHLNPPTSIIHR